MRDPWFGHRDYYFEPYGDKDEWTEWDFAIASALQTIEDMTDNHGTLVWFRESDKVDISAKKTIDKFQASIDRQTKGGKDKPYKPSPGESWIPNVSVAAGVEEPTYREYLQRLREGGGQLAPEEDWGTATYGKSWAEVEAEREAASVEE